MKKLCAQRLLDEASFFTNRELAEGKTIGNLASVFFHTDGIEEELGRNVFREDDKELDALLLKKAEEACQ